MYVTIYFIIQLYVYNMTLSLVLLVRMFVCLKISNELWLQKLKLLEKLVLKYILTLIYLQVLSLSLNQVIAAEGEMNAARALKEAAEVITNSPTALQLRYLQTLNFIAAERGSTILFPIPMDVLGGMSNWAGVSVQG